MTNKSYILKQYFDDNSSRSSRFFKAFYFERKLFLDIIMLTFGC
jgi:hypothetical protein